MRQVKYDSVLIRNLGKKAREAMQRIQADHIVYALGIGQEIQIMNNIPVEDDDFQRNYANGKYDMVYAVHCKR